MKDPFVKNSRPACVFAVVALRPDIEIRYGLTHPVPSNNPIRIAFNEWIAPARARLKVLFGPP